MKYIYKIFIALGLVVLAFACDNLELDLQANPNALVAEEASIADVYNSIQLTFGSVYSSAQGWGGSAARMYHASGYNYQTFASPSAMNGLWGNAYNSLFPDVKILQDLAVGNEELYGIYLGSSLIMKSYTLMTLVDLIGDVPYTEALQGKDVISPGVDGGESLYDSAMMMLDQAIMYLENNTGPRPAARLYYQSATQASDWIKLANSLKLKAALNMGDAATINALIAEDNIIDEESEDFQFNFGNQRTNPNTRHPFYQSHYETGDGDYLSNYFMFLLRADKLDASDNIVVDPRIRYYFYRKVNTSDGLNSDAYGCHFSALPDQSYKPDHWDDVDPRLPYCYGWTDGYIGRDHLNGEGIPVDGPVRTSYGLYPGGGLFDDDTFLRTNSTSTAGALGGLGQGIWPIMLSSFTDFMRAEAALSLGTNDDARELLESGMRKSIEKVIGFESVVESQMSAELIVREDTITIRERYGASAGDVSDYIDEVLAMYDAADAAGKLNIVIKEFYIAAFGNGIEAYNMYKRTGYPSNMQPALENNSGDFPRTFLYPSNNVDRNASVEQKTFSIPTFWDEGVTDLY